jgi:alpha-glucosidase
MKKSLLLFIIFHISGYQFSFSEHYSVNSPDNHLQLTISTGTQLTYQIISGNKVITDACAIGMKISGKTTIGENSVVLDIRRDTINTTLNILFGENNSIEDHYHEMTLIMEKYNLICRAYNDGVAYRFETKFKGGIIIENELVEFKFPQTPVVHLAYEEPLRTMSHWELPYSKINTAYNIPVNDYAINPLMFKNETTGLGITVVEADLVDYPGMYILRPDTSSRLIGKFAQVPNSIENDSKWASQKVLTRHNYIANTKGARLFPWRGFIITQDDKDLLNNDLIYKLSRPCDLEDTSWILPGKTAWDWLHDGELEGVDFPAGPGIERTLEFYKYYVDFAASNKLEYMTLDAGWNNSYIEELCSYAAEKNVKIFVWTYFNFILVDEPMLADFKRWGIAGVKADFIARDDQIATGWITTMAKRCAKYQLSLILHGSAKPTGLHRTFPNILNYEGVVGEEHNKWNSQCNPEYRTTFPFLRLLGGPADITPGSLRNKSKLAFMVKGSGAPNSLGTRSHQMAMYVICNHPLCFISDAPTEYNKFPAVIDFISKIPVVWDETMPLEAEIGKYIVMARKKGQEWYIGGITNWTAKNAMEINLSFLPSGMIFNAHIMKDDPEKNNDKGFRHGDAAVCVFDTMVVDNNSILQIDMAQGGGFVIHLSLEKINENHTEEFSQVTAWYDKMNKVIHVNAGYNHLNVSLTNILGHTIKTQQTEDQALISVADCSAGVYILNCALKNKKKCFKFCLD